MKTKTQNSGAELPLPANAYQPLPGESREDYLKFLAYAARCAEIAAQLTRLNLPLNLEILPTYTYDMEHEMTCTVFRWRERIPSWFIHIGDQLASSLAAEC